MFLPLGDAPNESTTRPWVTYGLIALNVVVYLWAILTTSDSVGYQSWIQDWGFVPVAPRVETFFTSMFMHAGLLHLGGNMLFLWIFGDNVEGRLGHVGYLFAYLACGIAAVLLFYALSPDTTVPLVGASGAIFGVLGFYFLAFPHHRVRLLVLLIGFIWVPARLVLGLFFALDLWRMFSPSGAAGGGTAFAAHVGGFVFGLGIALALRATRPRAELLERAAGHGTGAASARLAEARAALAAGRYERAETALLEVLRRHVMQPEAPEAALQLGRLYARAGRPEAARKPLAFAARLHPDVHARAAAMRELRALM